MRVIMLKCTCVLLTLTLARALAFTPTLALTRAHAVSSALAVTLSGGSHFFLPKFEPLAVLDVSAV
jgi:hypothetical protein